jgi:hypothetical protein
MLYQVCSCASRVRVAASRGFHCDAVVAARYTTLLVQLRVVSVGGSQAFICNVLLCAIEGRVTASACNPSALPVQLRVVLCVAGQGRSVARLPLQYCGRSSTCNAAYTSRGRVAGSLAALRALQYAAASYSQPTQHATFKHPQLYEYCIFLNSETMSGITVLFIFILYDFSYSPGCISSATAVAI